ncbi:unnamed protein product [Parnassius mnemosyne]|uniref:BED-type domain-containing protein n=1 Tax=Parnassius mnemosyne TaxID=213953 RepID=A0AAV1LE89_9NEOP
MDKLVFKEYTKRKFDKSSVWNSFLRTEDGSHAKCKLCKRILHCSNTTTCLHNHLKKQHPSVPDTRRNIRQIPATATPTTPTNEVVQEQDQRPMPKTKKVRIDDYYQNTKEDNMETVISKMTACDDQPFKVFCKSESIRMLFLKSGYEALPKSPNTIKKIVIEKSDQLKQELRKELSVLKAKGQKFSVSLDEWTSASNRRYVNINIHCPNFNDNDKSFRNLGLARITGRGTSERCNHILRVKLGSYDLFLEDDVVGVVTDGASVMTAMGRQIASFHQLCLAHVIQCAVVDVIYKNLYSQSVETVENSEEIDTEETLSTLVDSEAEESEDEETDENDDGQGFVVSNAETRSESRLNVNYKDLIVKVRKVVKFFKKSPTRTEVLNKHVLEDNKRAGLVLDCKTRWSSMADMVSKFLLLKDAILKALIDLKEKTMFSTYELDLLQDLSTTLTIVKSTVEAICQEKANLLTADTALQFMVTKLQENNGVISSRLLQALTLRIAQRRQADLVCTLKYLHNPNKYYQEQSSTVFPKVGNDVITKVIVDIQKKYFNQRPSTITYTGASDDEDDIFLADLQHCQNEEASRITNMSIKEQLQKKIDDEMCARPSTSTATCEDDLESSIKMQMALYDAGAPRQIHLTQAYDVLMCIPPTSVECERVFSSTKYICNHLRCKLSDDSLDALSFLRSHFQRIRKKQ